MLVSYGSDVFSYFLLHSMHIATFKDLLNAKLSMNAFLPGVFLGNIWCSVILSHPGDARISCRNVYCIKCPCLDAPECQKLSLTVFCPNIASIVPLAGIRDFMSDLMALRSNLPKSIHTTLHLEIYA